MSLPLPKVLRRRLAQIIAGRAAEAASRKDWRQAGALWRKAAKAFGPNLHQARQANYLRFAAAASERLSDPARFREEIAAYRSARQARSERADPAVAVFTTTAGSYDSIKLPMKLNARIDYFVFADVPVQNAGVYRICPLDYCDLDKTRASRYVKMHPHVLLKDYDFAVYMDANIAILGDIFPLIEAFMASGQPFGAIPHPSRSKLEEEAAACIALGKDDGLIIEDQLRRYRALGLEAAGLIEANVLMFALRDARVPKFLEAWWWEINQYSKRDQLSVVFALQQAGIVWYPLMPKRQSTRNHPAFALLAHDSNEGLAVEFNAAFSKGAVDPLDGPSYATLREARVAAQGTRSIDVVVQVHASSGQVRESLQSLLRSRGGASQRIVLIDDGTAAETADFLADMAEREPDLSLLRNDEARGFAGAAQQGLDCATGDFVLLVESGVLVSAGWAEKLADAVFSTTGAGIVAPLSRALSSETLPFPADIPLDEINRLCEAWTVAGLLPRLPLVAGPCLGIARSAVEAVGKIDLARFGRTPEWQLDYCLRAMRAGFTSLLATHTYLGGAALAAPAAQDAAAERERLMALYGREHILRGLRSMTQNPILDRLLNRLRARAAASGKAASECARLR